jgi:hypothetical protein
MDVSKSTPAAAPRLRLNCTRCGFCAVEIDRPKLPDTLHDLVKGFVRFMPKKPGTAGGADALAILQDDPAQLAAALELVCIGCLDHRGNQVVQLPAAA